MGIQGWVGRGGEFPGGGNTHPLDPGSGDVRGLGVVGVRPHHLEP